MTKGESRARNDLLGDFADLIQSLQQRVSAFNMEMAVKSSDSDCDSFSDLSSSLAVIETPRPQKLSYPTSPFTQFCVKSLSPLAQVLQSPGNYQYALHSNVTPRVLWKDANSPSPTFEGRLRDLPYKEGPRRCIQKLDFSALAAASVMFKASLVPVQITLTQDEEASPPVSTPVAKAKPKRNKDPPAIVHESANPICCNCMKSRCLKLYCDCFAANLYCNGCNCVNCLNTVEAEEVRREAINATLDRNPLAFKPKINVTPGAEATPKHARGCNCKKSGCLKKYCECFQSKVLCTDICKCIDCKNQENQPKPKKRRRKLSDDKLSTRKVLLALN